MRALTKEEIRAIELVLCVNRDIAELLESRGVSIEDIRALFNMLLRDET